MLTAELREGPINPPFWEVSILGAKNSPIIVKELLIHEARELVKKINTQVPVGEQE